jgi:hypothetical protein
VHYVVIVFGDIPPLLLSKMLGFSDWYIMKTLTSGKGYGQFEKL